MDEEQLLTFVLDDGGERLDSFRTTGASAYLYDLSDFAAARAGRKRESMTAAEPGRPAIAAP